MIFKRIDEVISSLLESEELYDVEYVSDEVNKKLTTQEGYSKFDIYYDENKKRYYYDYEEDSYYQLHNPSKEDLTFMITYKHYKNLRTVKYLLACISITLILIFIILLALYTT